MIRSYQNFIIIRYCACVLFYCFAILMHVTKLFCSVVTVLLYHRKEFVASQHFRESGFSVMAATKTKQCNRLGIRLGRNWQGS